MPKSNQSKIIKDNPYIINSLNINKHLSVISNGFPVSGQWSIIPFHNSYVVWAQLGWKRLEGINWPELNNSFGIDTM